MNGKVALVTGASSGIGWATAKAFAARGARNGPRGAAGTGIGRATFGRLDFGVNNAGIEGEFFPVTDFPEERWDDVIDINLKGTFLSMKYEARAMIAGGHGAAIVKAS